MFLFLSKVGNDVDVFTLQVEEYGEKAFSSVYFFLLECLLENNQEMKGHARHAANQVSFLEKGR